MANIKYLNQLELTGTFTPSNTAILAGDDGQTVAQKTQGQINAITPVPTPVSIANGGTGQITQQLAMNALAGAVTIKYYLRGDNTNVTMSAIQAADVPTLNQSTSGTAANITGIAALANGGTNADLTASNGGIFYSTASAGAILSGTATANQALLSGASTTPAWSTATYPATTTINQILYSSAANVIGGITTGNNGTLITSAGGVPSISSTLPSAVQGNITATGALASGSLAAGFTAVTVPLGGTGVASTTAYGVLCGGTTTTAALQNAGAGTTGQVLTSNGASALPSFQSMSAVLTISNAYYDPTGVLTLLTNTTNWQKLTGTNLTLGTGTYLLSYSAVVDMAASTAGTYSAYLSVQNTGTSAIVAGTYFLVASLTAAGSTIYITGFGGSLVKLVVSGSTTFQIYAKINSTNVSTFQSYGANITAIQIA